MESSSPRATRFRYQWLLLAALLLGLLTTRRTQQLTSPQVWVEDGTQILEKYIAQGWPSLFEPVNGYLITIPKIISISALSVSFTYYPLLSTILAWLFIVSVGLAIAYSPTQMNGRGLCSVLVFMTPADPEVFGLPSYTFWWASLLLFLIPLWDQDLPLLGWRLGVLILCGLSSPAIVAILPMLYLRSYWYRSLRAEHVVASIATLIAAIQVYFIVHSSAAGLPPLGSSLALIVPKFFGSFLIGNWISNALVLWPAGMGVLTLTSMWLFRERHKVSSWILLYLLVASIMMTAARVDPTVLHPKGAGPRYFFLPFIFTFWILVQFLYVSSTSTLRRITTEVVIAVTVLNAKPVWSRGHDDLRWESHVHSSPLFSDYAIPVHYDGNERSKHFLKVSGKETAALLKADLLFSWDELGQVPTFPYRVLSVSEAAGGEDESATLVSSTMRGGDHLGPRIKVYRSICSFKTSDADIGSASLKLRRGSHILYRSGPSVRGQSVLIEGQEGVFLTELPLAEEWVKLSFSNSKLPAEFVAVVRDGSRGYGEWLSVGLRD